MDANLQCAGTPPRAASWRLFVGVLALTVLAAGCRNRSDLVEAELRGREREVSQLRSDLQRSEALNYAMESELRSRAGGSVPFPPPGEIIDRPLALMANTIQRIELGRGTGGTDEDKWPGDEALTVVITPRDGDGSALKVPGHLVVKAFEVSMEGLKVPMGKWEVSSADLQKTWRSGVFGSGYFVKLPWRNWPNSEKLRVVAQFATLPDNRWFEADKDVTIRLMPGGPRSSVTPILPSGSIPVGPPAFSPAVPIPGGAEPLPPPVDGPRFPAISNSMTGAPAARIRIAKPAPSLEERMQQRVEAAKPSTNVEPSASSPHPALPRAESASEPLRIEAPPIVAEPVATPPPPARLQPPQTPD